MNLTFVMEQAMSDLKRYNLIAMPLEYIVA